MYGIIRGKNMVYCAVSASTPEDAIEETQESIAVWGDDRIVEMHDWTPAMWDQAMVLTTPHREECTHCGAYGYTDQRQRAIRWVCGACEKADEIISHMPA